MSQIITRSIEILRFVAQKPRSLIELTDLLGVHKSTVHRTLHTLSTEGFVRRRPDDTYGLGFGLIGLVATAIENSEIAPIARPHLEPVAEQYGHTVHLAQLAGDRIHYIDKIDGHGAVTMSSQIGHEVDLHTAGVAKAILAFLETSDLAKVEKNVTYERFTATTIIRPDRFREELNNIRAKGWAEDDGEKEDYINCVALPIFDARNKVCASFSVTALRAVTPLDELRALVPDLKQVAQDISRGLGWRP